jgi:hypothetical protein
MEDRSGWAAGWVRAVCACLLAAAVGASCTASAASPVPSAPAASLPGTPGHYENSDFSFDYPADWPVIAHDVSSGGVMYVLAVMGHGSWREGCTTSGDTMTCGADTFDVAPGGILVKIYRWWGGPLVLCSDETHANATLGTLAVKQTTDGSTVSWEIRVPGNEFGQNNNIFIEAHASNPAHLDQARAIVASFRWNPGGGAPVGCPSFGSSSP